MQKLKKSLENNIIKITLKESNNIFSIENSLELSSSIKKNYVLESKVLTTRFSKQIKFFDLLNISKLKYPLKLIVFSNIENFKAYLLNLEKIDKQSNLVLVKNKNIILKDQNFKLLKYNNCYNVFNTLRFSSSLILKFIKVLKVQVIKKS